MRVPLFFQSWLPLGHPCMKEMFERLNARQRPKFQAVQFETCSGNSHKLKTLRC